MSSNLLIGYPHIPFFGSLIANTTADGGYNAENAITGTRSDHFRTLAAVNRSQLDFDYGSAIAPDFVALARADLIRYSDSADSTLSLIGSNDSGFSSPATYALPLSVSALAGPGLEDVIVYPTGATSKRFWRFQVDTTASFKHRYSKVYFGNAFDLGRDPVSPKKIIRYPYSNSAKNPRYRFNFSWKGITNTIRTSFDANIYQYKDVTPIFLFTTNYHDLLNEHLVIHCKITSVKWTTQYLGTNNLDIEFEETI